MIAMNKTIQLIILIIVAFTASLHAQERIETAHKVLLIEKDTLMMEHNETRGPVMVEEGKRVNYKKGIYILQSDLSVLKNYGYRKTPAPDEALAAKARSVMAKGKAVEVGSFPYTSVSVTIKYYYLGKFKVPVPTGYYKDGGYRMRLQGYTRMMLPVYVVTDIGTKE